MFEKKDTAEYYNTTQLHYENWWNLKDTLALHYGIWDQNTNNFGESLQNTNKVLLEKGGIKDGDYILDAGCGVGGAAFFLAKSKNVKVTGITLSEKQIKLATEQAKIQNLTNNVNFKLMDYTKTDFPNETFDVIWACESICHTNDKVDFIKEALRVLKKGGRLILCDYYLLNDDQIDKNSYIEKWIKTWTISKLVSSENFAQNLALNEFNNIQVFDYTNQIKKSAKRMYYAGVLGAIPSIVYNLFYPNASQYAKTHYKGCLYQYWALKNNLWKWKIVSAIK